VSGNKLSLYTVVMREYRFHLSIPAHEYMAYYQGAAQDVVVELAGGFRVQFPAVNLRPFVTHEGVQGEFILRVDAQNKLQSFERLGD
jgi:hypothetical protein